MQRRSNRPLPLLVASPAREDNHSSLKSTIFNKKKRTIAANASHSTLAFAFFNLQSSSTNHKTLTPIFNLKEFASSRLEDIKRNLINRSHSEILKDLDASYSHLQSASRSRHKHANKRLRKLKRNTRGYWKRLMKAMKYEKFMVDAQATASRGIFVLLLFIATAISTRSFIIIATFYSVYCLAEFPDLSKINRNLTKEFIKDHLETDYVSCF
ncbi:hypothetical protein GOBAR_AA12545 [Gossypium barbadense]|uniref:Uncharacterized protein n=1 Tax=Gossypium barbadense TaxID=3634 RepID=A0A2P5XXM7_GOSBA|nr:hypothetical protein GOBAR_AA12545 [Gossypium barbadense]